MQGYLVITHQFGATSEQVREMMNVVTMTQGCTGEVAAAKACTFFHDLVEGNVDMETSFFQWCGPGGEGRLTRRSGRVRRFGPKRSAKS